MTFKRSQLRDHQFFERHKAAILLAQARGEIEDDLSPEPGGGHRSGRHFVSGEPDPTQEPAQEAPKPPAQRAGSDLRRM
ncbi:MAG: hypothetical protein ACHQ0J_05130 [Candidatus Dormibacterales bacterium]